MDVIELIRSKDDKKAYQLTKGIVEESADSDRYYPLLNDFASLLNDEKSYVRTRAFLLCCAQSKWDSAGKLTDIMPGMLVLLHDDKPTVVRQCLKALEEPANCCPELREMISAELDSINPDKYRDSMAPLILKDIAALKSVIEKAGKK